MILIVNKVFGRYITRLSNRTAQKCINRESNSRSGDSDIPSENGIPFSAKLVAGEKESACVSYKREFLPMLSRGLYSNTSQLS